MVCAFDSKLAVYVLSSIDEACCMRFSEHCIYVLIQAMRILHAHFALDKVCHVVDSSVPLVQDQVQTAKSVSLFRCPCK